MRWTDAECPICNHEVGPWPGMISCATCGTFTNHTTAQHDDAMRPRCSMCGELTRYDDEERARCDECQAEYWEFRQELYYDNLAKEEGGQG